MIPPTNATGQPRKPHQVRSQLPYVAAINCLFAEFDGGADVALARLESLPYYPTAVIHSGGGLHCYWPLEDVQPVTDANRVEIAHIQRAWVDLVGADDGAKDLARVLRVPGTHNLKPGRQLPDGTFPKVTMLEYLPKRLYELGRLAAVLPRYSTPVPTAAAAQTHGANRQGGGAGALRWAYANLQTGSRHERARWLACALRDSGVSQLAAKVELERFKDAANRLGGRQLDSAEITGIITWTYGKGAQWER